MSCSESGLAASYYNLYGRLNTEGSSKAPPFEEDRGVSSASSNRAVVEGVATVVIEEEWTDQYAAEAASLLLAHQDKCRIETPLTESEQESWDRFYQNHQANFFKDKHYLEIDFPDEFAVTEANPSTKRCCVEIGCGVGNAVLPLLEQSDEENELRADIEWTVHCMDLSPVAINLLQEDYRFRRAFKSGRAFAYCCDITQPEQLPGACINAASVATLFFCLSAVDPCLQSKAAQIVARTLAPGGVLVIRDYGRYDQGQLKLGLQRNKLLGDNFYRKYDGTKCFYFSLEELHQLFVVGCGLEEFELRYLCKVFENRSQGSSRRRIWVSARFRKPT